VNGTDQMNALKKYWVPNKTAVILTTPVNNKNTEVLWDMYRLLDGSLVLRSVDGSKVCYCTKIS